MRSGAPTVLPGTCTVAPCYCRHRRTAATERAYSRTRLHATTRTAGRAARRGIQYAAYSPVLRHALRARTPGNPPSLLPHRMMQRRRVEQLIRHLGFGHHASSESPGDNHSEQLRLLSDDDVRRFIADGILALPVDDLPAEVHRAIHEHGWRLHKDGTNPGDGIYHEIPELEQLLATSTVSGALTSLLGPGWTMASHRHMHTNIPAGGNNQSLHKDSQRTKPPLHRPRSLFIFYVPRGATVQMGPTAVVPSGHFVSADDQDWTAVNDDARNLGPGLRRTLPTAPLEQGTIFLAHHGVIHGATARLEDDKGHPWRKSRCAACSIPADCARTLAC